MERNNVVFFLFFLITKIELPSILFGYNKLDTVLPGWSFNQVFQETDSIGPKEWSMFSNQTLEAIIATLSKHVNEYHKKDTDSN